MYLHVLLWFIMSSCSRTCLWRFPPKRRGIWYDVLLFSRVSSGARWQAVTSNGHDLSVVTCSNYGNPKFEMHLGIPWYPLKMALKNVQNLGFFGMFCWIFGDFLGWLEVPRNHCCAACPARSPRRWCSQQGAFWNLGRLDSTFSSAVTWPSMIFLLWYVWMISEWFLCISWIQGYWRYY